MNDRNKLYLVIILCVIIISISIIISCSLHRYEYIPEIDSVFDKISGKVLSR